jgi:homoserine kinase type II
LCFNAEPVRTASVSVSPIMEHRPPRVEMLWESQDPLIALKKFGFQTPDLASKWVLDVVTELWDVTAVSCERIVLSALNALAWLRTDHGDKIAKWSIYRPGFEFLSEVAKLTSWLDAQGVPVSAPIAARAGSLRAHADGVLIELQSVCPGELLDVVDPSQVLAAGATLAQLHEALARYPDAGPMMAADDDPAWPRRNANSDLQASLAGRIDAWLAAHGEKVPTDLALSLRGKMGGAPLIDRPLQLVHYDYRSANVICEGGRVRAVLDFEQVGMDHALVDVAWAAVMLGTRFRNWQPTPQKVISTFLKGYCSSRQLSDAEAGWLPRLLLWQMLEAANCGWNPDAWMAAATEQAETVREH